MAINSFVGASGSKWNIRSNWSNNDNNYNNCDCIIGTINGSQITVDYDGADGNVGDVGQLILKNATLNFIGSTPQNIQIGNVFLFGSSVVNVGPNWYLQTGKVRVTDTSSVTIQPGGYWECQNEADFSLDNTSSLLHQGMMYCGALRGTPYTTITLQECSVFGNVFAGGDLYLKGAGVNQRGDVETGGGLIIDVGSAGVTCLSSSGNILFGAAPLINATGGGTILPAPYAIANAQIGYHKGNINIGGLPCHTVASQVGGQTVLSFVPGSDP
jgi:hypothetical protein